MFFLADEDGNMILSVRAKLPDEFGRISAQRGLRRSAGAIRVCPAQSGKPKSGQNPDFSGHRRQYRE
jgi:hypothetical protein